MKFRHLLLVFLTGACAELLSQPPDKKKSVFRDTLDGALDLSDFLINTNGFVPLPFIITEPALGGFGGGIAPIFIKKRPMVVDTVRGKRKVTITPPDVTGAGAIYTANNSWGAMVFRSGTWLKAKSKYRVMGGYVDLNMNFYRTGVDGVERTTEFNLETIPLIGYFLKRFGDSPWSAGINYVFLNTKVKVDGNDLPDFVKDKEINSVVSMPGLVVEYDNRDNIFSPDKGVRVQATLGISDGAFGSDYEYQNVNVFMYAYMPLGRKFIGGLRYEMQQVFNDPPFYLLPYIDLRGVPTARYQGNIFSVVEGELRWDVYKRWSAVAFAGTGKAYDTWSQFQDSDWVTSGGAGFRYLMARKFKLRMGLDVARGPEQWAYYIIFGSAWLK